MTRQSTGLDNFSSGREVGLWAGLVAIAQVFTLLGIPLALVLAFTRLRSNSAIVRWGLVGLAAAILVLQVIGLSSGVTTLDVGPARRVN